jgi:hypothetical protein
MTRPELDRKMAFRDMPHAGNESRVTPVSHQRDFATYTAGAVT